MPRKDQFRIVKEKVGEILQEMELSVKFETLKYKTVYKLICKGLQIEKDEGVNPFGETDIETAKFCLEQIAKLYPEQTKHLEYIKEDGEVTDSDDGGSDSEEEMQEDAACAVGGSDLPFSDDDLVQTETDSTDLY